MKKYNIIIAAILLVGLALPSCTKDLNTEPLNKDVTTSKNVFNDPASYKQFLAKLYGAMTLTGQRGEYGKPEISAPDEGTTSFLRMYWGMQEITTDEAICAWGDPGLTEFHGHSWSAQNGYVTLLYQRVFINIAYCNEYIREVSSRIAGLPSNMQGEVSQYVAEARFLRAFYYYIALDMWGNVPFVTEKDAPGAYLPKQIKRADLFKYIESELNAVLPSLADPGQNEYARADKAAAWMVLAKLYLNAEVYLGKGNSRYTECIANCNNITGSGFYSLANKYNELFLTDNDRLRSEIILPVSEDGNSTRNYGGVTYIVHAQVGSYETGFGISGGWYGNRFTNAFADKFADKTGNTDKRAMFYTTGQTLDINNPTVFTEGYLSTKYRNVSSTGVVGQNSTFVDIDFPLFRLADVYLMYAECVLRGGTGGDVNTALNYVNLIRQRAYGNATGNITAAQLNLPFILDERARELYWEGHRRTDLIRFGQFSGDTYLWDWKGDVKQGKATPSYVDLFPIPATDIAVNTNLVQNEPY